jgi:hypothetical protein
MNRSILIVICDFLLVSLLAFSTVDINKVADEGTPRQAKFDVATNQADASKDLAAVMKVALDEERKNRDLLMGELTKAREVVARQQQDLQGKDQQAARLRQEQAGLQVRLGAVQTNIQALTDQLTASSNDVALSRERLAALEAELRKQVGQAAALQKQLGELEKSNRIVLGEKQQLTAQLQVAEVERRHATEQAVRMQEQVKAEREEKAKLAESVKTLASGSTQLAQEIRESRPLASNTIFNEFATHRVRLQIDASRSTLFGIDSNRRAATEVVFVDNGTNTLALCHVQDTPLTFFDPGTEWEGLAGTLSRNGASVPIRSLYFCQHDPRVVFLPVAPADVRALGARTYRVASEPFKFQDAVLIGAREGYYGECRFEIDLTTPGYVRLDRSLLRGLFGKFNPSSGDLVFSRMGELLGIMVNGSYCMMLHNYNSAATLQFATDVREQHTGQTLARLYNLVSALPYKLR